MLRPQTPFRKPPNQRRENPRRMFPRGSLSRRALVLRALHNWSTSPGYGVLPSAGESNNLRCAEAAPSLSLGSDFHLSYENVQDALIRPEYYSIDGSQYLLVELSNFGIPAQVEATFSQMVDLGIIPIITHPERNPILQQTPTRVLRWVEIGC